MLYSKSTGGFYDPAINNTIPADAVQITGATYSALLAAQSQGKVITSDGAGNPIAIDPATLLTLPQAQAAQIAKISSACQAALVGGFTSSALGSAHTYPSQDADQRNLLSATMASQGQGSTWSTSLWCANGTVWGLTPHTATQVQQVSADWLGYRQAQQQKYAALIAQINAATSVSAVQAINW